MLTPEFLRDMADWLDCEPGDLNGNEFMCHYFSRYGPVQQFQDLATKAGLTRMDGTLFKEVKGPNSLWSNKFYMKNAMPVRFMFLEFLAHYMEDCQ